MTGISESTIPVLRPLRRGLRGFGSFRRCQGSFPWRWPVRGRSPGQFETGAVRMWPIGCWRASNRVRACSSDWIMDSRFQKPISIAMGSRVGPSLLRTSAIIGLLTNSSALWIAYGMGVGGATIQVRMENELATPPGFGFASAGLLLPRVSSNWMDRAL